MLPMRDNDLNETTITITTLLPLLLTETQGYTACSALLLISARLPAHQGHHYNFQTITHSVVYGRISATLWCICYRPVILQISSEFNQ